MPSNDGLSDVQMSFSLTIMLGLVCNEFRANVTSAIDDLGRFPVNKTMNLREPATRGLNDRFGGHRGREHVDRDLGFENKFLEAHAIFTLWRSIACLGRFAIASNNLL